LLIRSSWIIGCTGTVPPVNPWFSWSYVSDNTAILRHATAQHITLTVVSVGLAFLIAFPLALVARRWRWLEGPILGVAGALYAIPSLALFVALAPTLGLRARTAVVGLTIYALLILLRNVITGLDGVPEDVREAARGMGYSSTRMLTRVELPLALPAIVAGLRVATVSTIGLATIGAVVGAGGLGSLILEGFNNLYRAQIMTASVLCVALAVGSDLIFVVVLRLLTPWAHR
jgi:osmoprotectant transport system permease protein